MTTSMDLVGLVKAVLMSATDAGTNVFGPGDWPAMPENLPLLKLRLLREVRTGLSRSGAPQFTTVATVRIIAEAQAFASEDNAGAEAAQVAAWAIKRQVEVAVINSFELFREIQQLSSMRSDLAFSADGSMHVAGIQMDLDLEFYEGDENFAPNESDEITSAHLTITNYAPGAPVTAEIPTT
jgi:hypothetical protein